MSKKKRKDREGVVYSTSSDFEYEYNEENEEQETLPKEKQKLAVYIDNKAKKKGKAGTVVTGFVGTEDDLKDLGKFLKTKCAVGGSVKDGDILIQGDVRDKVMDILTKEGYKVRKL